MAQRTDVFDLDRLSLRSGEGRKLELAVQLDDVRFGNDRYAVEPRDVPVRLDVSRTTHNGWALRLRFSAALTGPCMRCLEPAAPEFAVDAREVDQPGGGDELSSPYVTDGDLDLRSWRSEEHTSELQSRQYLVCRLLLEKNKTPVTPV